MITVKLDGLEIQAEDAADLSDSISVMKRHGFSCVLRQIGGLLYESPDPVVRQRPTETEIAP